MFVDGAMPFEEARDATGTCVEKIVSQLSELPEAIGTLVVRINVEADGRSSSVRFLTDTLVARPWDVRENDATTARAQIQMTVHQAFSDYEYPSAEGASVITVPITFD